MKNNKVIWVIFLIIAAGLTAIFYYVSNQEMEGLDKTGEPLTSLKVQAGWVLNGEFANVCSAIINGYYQEEGLAVELLPGGPTGASFIIATNAVAQNQDLEIAIDCDVVPMFRGITT